MQSLIKRLSLTALFPLLLLAVVWWAIKYIWATVFSPNSAWTLAVSADQLANAAFNGNPDETVSSRAYRHSQDNTDRECWAVWLCKLLNKVEKDHCKKSEGV
jgi:cytoskeletal protein RodZ